MGIIEKAEKFAKEEYKKNDPIHRWGHIIAVRKRALEIAKHVKDVDYELLNLAVIFHDIDYNSEETYKENYKNHPDNSVKLAEKFLRDNNYPEEKIKKLKQTMLDHSTPYRKEHGDSKITEAKILYDADKSLCLITLDKYNKYYHLLYFDFTRKLVKKPNS